MALPHHFIFHAQGSDEPIHPVARFRSLDHHENMDFGRSMIRTPGIVARSGIRLVDEDHLGGDDLDRRVCRAANHAAMDLFLGNDNPSRPPPRKKKESDAKGEGGADGKDVGSKEESSPDHVVPDAVRDKLPLVDCSLYDEQHLPPARRLIKPGDLVVVFESFNDLNFVYAKSGAEFCNRNGRFPHDEFIGKPYGCKIRSVDNEGLGFVYLLRPTPELWARSLPHRTQIVHELDASLISYYLDLRPNMTVCESGTGSGAMSHVILRSIAPGGKLHTYEFNKMRKEKAREEFEGHGLGHLVTCHHRDVCGKRSLPEREGKAEKTESSDENPGNSENGDDDEEDDGRGGFQLGQAAAHAIFLDLPEPWLAVPHAAHTIKPNGRVCSYSPCMEQTQRTVAAMKEHGFHSIRTVEARLKEYFVDEVGTDGPPTDLPVIMTEETASLEKERCANGGVLPTKPTDVNQDTKKEESAPKLEKVKGKKRKVDKILCARPFAMMRGHSAFLTFATAGNVPRPDPNESK